jgi:hypothetical protein
MTKPKNEVMENSGINFEENMEDVLVEDQPSNFNPQGFSTPGPKGDEDEDEDEKGNNEGGDEEEPAIDPDIVHSPVPTDPGPGPKVI